jgi:hypothetical protein
VVVAPPVGSLSPANVPTKGGKNGANVGDD